MKNLSSLSRRIFGGMLFMFLLTFAFDFSHAQQGGGGTSWAPSSIRQWYRMLDTTFMWEQMQLPKRGIPASVGSDPSVQRAWVLGINYWNDSTAYDKVLHYWVVVSNLRELFFGNDCKFEYNYFSDIKWRLADKYHINIDSLEFLARGGVGYPKWIDENDTMSFSALQQFSISARRTSTLSFIGFEWTAGDPFYMNLRIDNNALQLASFRTTFRTYFENFIETIHGFNGFTPYFQTNNWGQCGPEYAVGGLDFNGGAGDTGLSLLSMKVLPLWAGTIPVYQYNGLLGDTLGLTDYTAWTHKSVMRIYDRADINLNGKSNIVDAVRCVYEITRGIPPALKHLGDVNYNDVRDSDDPIIIFFNTIWNDKRNTVQTDSANGTLHVQTIENGQNITIDVAFNGDLGDAQRLGASLQFDPNVMQFQDIVWESGNVIESMSQYYVNNGKVNFLLYDTMMTEGALLHFTFHRINAGNVAVTLNPLAGNNFLTFHEVIKVIYGGVMGVGEEIKIPTQYVLDQNYPNPFNPTTTIYYNVPENAFITLSVFNLLGENIATLVDEEKSAGIYEATFDASQVPSGIYFYRLQAEALGEEKFSQVRKMILMK